MNVYFFKLQLYNLPNIGYNQHILINIITEALNQIFINCQISIKSILIENTTNFNTANFNMTNMSILDYPLNRMLKDSAILDIQIAGNYNNCVKGFKVLKNDGILRTNVGDLYVGSFSWFNNTYNYLPMSNTSNVQFDDVVYNDMSILIDQEKVNDKQEQIIQSNIRKICVLD